jgi:hypothetical protein
VNEHEYVLNEPGVEHVDAKQDHLHGDNGRSVVQADGTVTLTIPAKTHASAASLVAQEMAWAQEEYERHYPSDTRSMEVRVEDAWQAHFNGDVQIGLAVCPYCGVIPALSTYGFCCELNEQLMDVVMQFNWPESVVRTNAAVTRFWHAIANDDSIEADEAAAELILLTNTRDLDDAFVILELWPRTSCRGGHCFETSTRVWHAPNWCVEVDGEARDMKAWCDGGQIGPRPKLRSGGEGYRFEEPSDEEKRLSKERYQRYETERWNRLEELYGVEVVRKAREEQRASDAEREMRNRARRDAE